MIRFVLAAVIRREGKTLDGRRCNGAVVVLQPHLLGRPVTQDSLRFTGDGHVRLARKTSRAGLGGASASQGLRGPHTCEPV